MKEDRPSRFFRVVLVHWRFKSIDVFFHKRITVLEGVLSTRNKYNQNNNGALLRPFNRDFTMPCLKHFIEILPRSAYTISQRFYNALLIQFYRDFTIPGLYHFTVYRVQITKDNLYKCKIYKDSIDFFGKSINFSVFLLYSAGKITDFS